MMNLDALWTYQEAEQQLEKIEAGIRSTPSRVKLNKLHKILKSQQTAITRLNEEMESRESQCTQMSQQLSKLDERLELEMSELSNMQQDDESTAEEMTELKNDIERLGREISSGLRELKQLQFSVSKALEEYQSTRLTAGKAKKEYDALRIVCEKERADSTDEIAEVTAKIERLRQDVDPKLMERYNRVKLHNAQPMARVINSKCSGCNMSLPMVMLKKLSSGSTVVECENCGRILYVENPGEIK